jgi:hypothetical protein
MFLSVEKGRERLVAIFLMDDSISYHERRSHHAIILIMRP